MFCISVVTNKSHKKTETNNVSVRQSVCGSQLRPKQPLVSTDVNL